MIPAIVQTVAAILAIYRGYWAFGLSIAIWLPVMWTWSPNSPIWERTIWIWCAVPFTVLQAMAAIEAFYKFARWFWLAVRVSMALGAFSIAAMAWRLVLPSDSLIGNVVQVAKYERIGSGVFLVLAVAFFASIGGFATFEGWWSLRNREGRHLCLMTALAFTWMLPALMPHPDVAGWQSVSVWAIWSRTVILAIWIAAVRDRQSATPNAPSPSGGRLA